MKSDINDLCEAFLAALTNAGYAVKSIENYKQVSNRFKKFCAENGYDTYTVNIGQIFADNVFNEETGAFVGYRNVMYGRFVRLINSFYLQGTFDFSMVTKEKNLPKSIHLIEIYQDYMEHLKTQYSNIGTIGFFQNGMLHLLRYMEDGGILTLKDLAVSDVVNYICSWSQKHQRNVLCILRNIFRHFGREDLYFAVAGIHPYRTKRIVPMFTDNEIMSIEEVLSSPSVSHRDAAIFFLGLTTGMRAVDVVDLRLANIDWDNETISLVVGTAAKMARETCNAVPENVHCHLFRKTKAMDLYKNGIPLPFIMQLLGHESISTTSGFYAFATLEMMSDAINKSVPIIGGTEKLWKNKNAKQALYTLD